MSEQSFNCGIKAFRILWTAVQHVLVFKYIFHLRLLSGNSYTTEILTQPETVLVDFGTFPSPTINKHLRLTWAFNCIRREMFICW